MCGADRKYILLDICMQMNELKKIKYSLILTFFLYTYIYLYFFNEMKFKKEEA